MKLLIAVDLKQDPDQVVHGAIPWVERLGATADLAYAEEVRGMEPFLRDPELEARILKDWEAMRKEDLRQLQKLLALLPAASRGEVRMHSGSPGTVVTGLAEGYDAVIVGTHGRRGLAHLWMGSVAERIVRTCPVPLIVLRLEPLASERDF